MLLLEFRVLFQCSIGAVLTLGVALRSEQVVARSVTYKLPY